MSVGSSFLLFIIVHVPIVRNNIIKYVIMLSIECSSFFNMKFNDNDNDSYKINDLE